MSAKLKFSCRLRVSQHRNSIPTMVMPEQPKLILNECIYIIMITNDVQMNGSSILVRKQRSLHDNGIDVMQTTK